MWWYAADPRRTSDDMNVCVWVGRTRQQEDVIILIFWTFSDLSSWAVPLLVLVALVMFPDDPGGFSHLDFRGKFQLYP